MYEIINNEIIDEYNEFLEKVPGCSFLQTVMWAKVKSQWKHRVLVCRDDGEIVAGVLILVRKLSPTPYTIFYAPRGPQFLPGKYYAISQLTDGIKALAKKEKALFFKADPAILSTDNEFISCVKNAGFTVNDTGKNFDGVQPRYIYALNIKNKTADEIISSFHSKTRYNIRLSQRKGVTVRIGNYNDLPAFYEILKETGTRDNFNIRAIKYFQTMYNEMSPENLRLYMAEHEGKVIAGTIVIYFGSTVWYLYGASSNESRNVMPNYSLQWEMIQWAIEKKCDVYDFMGISGDDDPSNPLYGLYKFKKGFSGETVEYIGEIEMVFKPFMNKIVNLLKKVLP